MGSMNTKDIEDIEEIVEHCMWMKDKFLERKNWIEYIVNTLTEHYEAEVERAVEEVKSVFLKIIKDQQARIKILEDGIALEHSMRFNPTKTDKRPNITSDK